MVAGQSGLGKTTFLKTLFNGEITPPLEGEYESMEILSKTESITPYIFEMEAADGNRLLVEAIDSPGYDDDVAAEQRAKEVLAYIENSFDEVFDEEKKISRNPKFEEHRIHALLYFIEPTGLGLKKNDAEFMQIIGSRINIIPIIAKADGLSRDEMANFKSKVWADFVSNQINVFDFQKSDEGNAESLQLLHSVIGSTFPLENGKIGRTYPWGFVDALSEDHCDFWLLRENLLEDDLKEVTEDVLYEQYRTEKLLKTN